MNRGAAAVAGGGMCARGGGGGDDDIQMPAMIRILDGIQQQQPQAPDLTRLKEIFRDYETNPANTTLKSRIKDQLLNGALDSILIVLNDLFGSPDNLTEAGVLKPECVPVFRSILDALMDDLPLHTYIKMLFQLFMKSYYNDSRIRAALGAAFLGSTLYVSWVSAISPIARLSGQVGGYVMTVCNMLMNAATDPAQLQSILETFLSQQQAMDYSTDIIAGAAGFIEFLKNQTNPSNIIFICALTNLYFMEKLYPAQNFQPLAELRQAAAAAGAGARAVPAVPANAPEFGQQPQGQDPSFIQMIQQPLIDAGGMVVERVKQYLLTTVNRFRKIFYVMPGVVVNPSQTLEAGCLNFMLSISDYIITHAEQQAAGADMNASVIKATIILKSIFDGEPLLNQSPSEVAGVIYTLAFSIRNRVIENIHRTQQANSPTFEAAVALLESTCLVFKSRLTQAEIDAHMLSVCVVGRIQWLLDNTRPKSNLTSDDSQSSTRAVNDPDSQPNDFRDKLADEQLKLRYKARDKIYFTVEEIQNYEQDGFSIFTSLQKGLSMGIGSMVKCAQTLGIINFTSDLMTQLRNNWNPPADPHKLVCADTSIERLLTKPFIRQIRIIDDIIRTGLLAKKSADKIYNEIVEKFKEGGEDGETVARPFMKHLLMLGILEEKLHLHDMEVAFGVIVKNKIPSLAVVLNSDTTQFRDNFIRMITADPAAAVVESPPVAPSEEGVFNELRREIQNVVCQPAGQSTEQASAKAADVIIAGAEALEALEPRIDQAPENDKKAAELVSEVNSVMSDMISGLEKTGADVGGMVLATAILDQTSNEEESSGSMVKGGVDVFSSADADAQTAAAQAAQEAQAAAAQAAQEAQTAQTQKRKDDRERRENEKRNLDGGKSRRKSRKNAKKTTRRNKKIVRKSSKNTKQQRGRSSRRHRSSRKSRK